MDNLLILAVAGSGKTTHIANQLNLHKRSLIITYTETNFRNLRNRILCKFGYFPENIRLMTYFSFLYSFCYRPFLFLRYKAESINYNENLNRYERIFKDTSINEAYFFDQYRHLYANRIAKFLEVQGIIGDIRLRLERYFDNLFIDEVQDIAGHDFNFLMDISSADIDKTFVGDFYQHTYDTSRDGSVNKNLHNDVNCYKKRFLSNGFTIDTTTLRNSHRCSPSICEFIRDNLGIEIYSNRTDDSQVRMLSSQEQADACFQDEKIIKLFYKDHYKYNCYSKNWGESKGENGYSDVCVVLTVNAYDFITKKKKQELPPQTRNKLYVACSRANNDLFLINPALIRK